MGDEGSDKPFGNKMHNNFSSPKQKSENLKSIQKKKHNAKSVEPVVSVRSSFIVMLTRGNLKVCLSLHYNYPSRQLHVQS